MTSIEFRPRPLGKPTPANTDFMRVWDEVVAPKYLRFREVQARALVGHGDAALEGIDLVGKRVLDVGCGFGDASIALAEAVGPRGRVVGLDCSKRLLTAAMDDAGMRYTNLRFDLGDAQTIAFSEKFDVIFSRFGVMFFQSPTVALGNLRRATVSGGRLAMVVWRTIADNPWLGAAKAVALRHLPPAPDDGEKCGPGPFSMANADTVRAQLEAAGWTDIAFRRVDRDVLVGRTLDEAVAFAMALGPAGEIAREAGAQYEAKRDVLDADLRTALASYARPEGIVMGSSSWVVTATSPG